MRHSGENLIKTGPDDDPTKWICIYRNGCGESVTRCMYLHGQFSAAIVGLLLLLLLRKVITVESFEKLMKDCMYSGSLEYREVSRS